MLTKIDKLAAVTSLLLIACHSDDDGVWTEPFACANDLSCIIHVTKTGEDTNSGSTWNEPMGTVNKALECGRLKTTQGICSNVEIWVAAGRHVSSDRDLDFKLVSNVALYGGFAGTETAREERNVKANETVLAADGTGSAFISAPTDLVVGATGATIDGFTIHAGHTGMINDSASTTIRNCTFYGCPYGILNTGNARPTITDCVFTNSYINAMANYGYSSPVITNCAFIDNHAGFGMGRPYPMGAAMDIDTTSSPVVSNCVFKGNTAAVDEAIADSGSSTFSNCLFGGNGYQSSKEISVSFSPRSTVTNCTFVNERVQAPALLTNSICWPCKLTMANGSNPVVSNSIIQGGVPSGTHVLDKDPLFVNAAASDFRLSAGSPAIDVGNSCAAHVPLNDLDGKPRWDIASVANNPSALDLGAFEYQGTPGTDTTVSSFACP